MAPLPAEAHIAQTDTYRKERSINDVAGCGNSRPRRAATRRDVAVVALVFCITAQLPDRSVELKVGEEAPRDGCCAAGRRNTPKRRHASLYCGSFRAATLLEIILQ